MFKCKSMEENRYWSKYRTKTGKELAFFIIQYGTRQETIKQQDKVRDVVVGGRYQLTP